MFQGIYETHYTDYLTRIARVDGASAAPTLGIEKKGETFFIPLFNETYQVSKQGIFDPSGQRASYGICVILSKYLLNCPDRVYHTPDWVSFKDFKRDSHFTNVNIFATDTEQTILKHFANTPDALSAACSRLGGTLPETPMPYDIAFRVQALPRIALLLLFNGQDDGFPAYGTVLFERHAEFYLDPESLFMLSAALVKKLVKLAG